MYQHFKVINIQRLSHSNYIRIFFTNNYKTKKIVLRIKITKTLTISIKDIIEVFIFPYDSIKYNIMVTKCYVYFNINDYYKIYYFGRFVCFLLKMYAFYRTIIFLMYHLTAILFDQLCTQTQDCF